MIRFISGRYMYYDGEAIIIETPAGIGFRIFVPDTSPVLNSREGDNMRINTYMQVKDDGISLYGFPDTESLRLFEQLITVKSVGPKAGLAIMSLADQNTIKYYIQNKDAAFIARAAGIGKKTADRVILELCDKVSAVPSADIEGSMGEALNVQGEGSKERSGAVAALTTLGYSAGEAKEAVRSVTEEGLTIEEYVKKSLKYLL